MNFQEKVRKTREDVLNGYKRETNALMERAGNNIEECFKQTKTGLEEKEEIQI